MTAVAHHNPKTLLVTRMRAYEDPRTLFVYNYPWFEEACRAVREPGVAVIAVDDWSGSLVAYRGIRATLGRCVAIVGGRHERCDIVLPREDVALRAFTIVVDPVDGWEIGSHVGYRMIDLRTTDGLEDEHGKPLRSFRAEGPAIVRCGGYTIFLLPLGNPSDWPDSGNDSWDALPERVYLDERRPLRTVTQHRRTSLIFEVPSLKDASVRLVSDDLCGVLEIEDPRGRATIPVGTEALAAGVLLGRYERCDLIKCSDPTVSRVHAMLIQRTERIFVVDLASSYGVGVAGQPRSRIVPLAHDSVLRLGRKTLLRWREAHRSP